MTACFLPTRIWASPSRNPSPPARHLYDQPFADNLLNQSYCASAWAYRAAFRDTGTIEVMEGFTPGRIQCHDQNCWEWGTDTGNIGTVTGLLYVWLEIKHRRSMWMVGIVMSVCYIVVFGVETLYASMGLYVYYLGISLYGWFKWATDRSDPKAAGPHAGT